MSKSGRWDLQPHTRNGHDLYIDDKGNQSHYYSSKFWLKDFNRLETKEEFENRIHEDFLQAKQDIEKNFSIKAISFSFPFGDYGQNNADYPETKNMILNKAIAIYNIGFYQIWPGHDFYFNYPNKDFLLKRIEVGSNWKAKDLMDQLEIGKAKTLAYKDGFSENKGWIKTWGHLTIEENKMTINSASTTGASVFLDGTYSWRDYIMKADAYPMKGQVFSLKSRYKDEKNYAACSFSEKSIEVEQVLSGEKKVLSELKGDFKFIEKNRKMGIGAQNNTIDCYLDDKIVMKGYNLDERLGHGGIGFETWDPQADNSELIIKSVSVEEVK